MANNIPQENIAKMDEYVRKWRAQLLPKAKFKEEVVVQPFNMRNKLRAIEPHVTYLKMNDPTDPHHKEPAPHNVKKDPMLNEMFDKAFDDYEIFMKFLDVLRHIIVFNLTEYYKQKYGKMFSEKYDRLYGEEEEDEKELFIDLESKNLANHIFDRYLEQKSSYAVSERKHHQHFLHNVEHQEWINLLDQKIRSLTREELSEMPQEELLKFSSGFIRKVLGELGEMHVQVAANNAEVDPRRYGWKEELMRELNRTRNEREAGFRKRGGYRKRKTRSKFRRTRQKTKKAFRV